MPIDSYLSDHFRNIEQQQPIQAQPFNSLDNGEKRRFGIWKNRATKNVFQGLTFSPHRRNQLSAFLDQVTQSEIDTETTKNICKNVLGRLAGDEREIHWPLIVGRLRLIKDSSLNTED